MGEKMERTVGSKRRGRGDPERGPPRYPSRGGQDVDCKVTRWENARMLCTIF